MSPQWLKAMSVEAQGQRLAAGIDLGQEKKKSVLTQILFTPSWDHCWNPHGARWRRLNSREEKVYGDENSVS